MRSDHRAQLAAAVARFLADIRRLARTVLQEQRDRLLATVEPSRDRRAARVRVSVPGPAARLPAASSAATRPARQPATPPVDVKEKRARPAATRLPPRRMRKAAVDVEKKRARPAATRLPPRRTRKAAVDAELTRTPPTVRPAAAKAPAASPRTRTSASTPGPAATEPAAVAAPAITTPATTALPAAGAHAADRAETASLRRRGTVKWFDAGKGYGFIRGDDGQDAFVHHSAVSEAGFRAFNQGQTVEYEVRHSPKGLQVVALRSG